MSSGRAEPVWFGPEESPLFGVLHTPDALVRGAIVLCPPLGREYTYSYSTFAELATRLTQLRSDSTIDPPATPLTESQTVRKDEDSNTMFGLPSPSRERWELHMSGSWG